MTQADSIVLDSIVLDRQDPEFKELATPTPMAVTFTEQATLSTQAPGKPPSPQDFFRWAKRHVTSVEPSPILPEDQCAAYVVRLADRGAAVTAVYLQDGRHVWKVAPAHVSQSGIAYAPIESDHQLWSPISGQPLSERWVSLFLNLVKSHYNPKPRVRYR